MPFSKQSAHLLLLLLKFSFFIPSKFLSRTLPLGKPFVKTAFVIKPYALVVCCTLLAACQSTEKNHFQPSGSIVKQLQQIELDGRQNGTEYTLSEYYKIAKQTQNIPIIKRGIQIAAVNSNFDEVIRFSELWHKADKLSTEPSLITISAYFKKQNIEAAAQETFSFIKNYTPLAPTDIIKEYTALDPTLKTEYITLLEDNKKSMIKYAAYWQLLTNMAYVDKNIEQAQNFNTKGLKQHSSDTKLLIQQAELQDNPEMALTVLEDSVEKYTKNKVLNLYYTRQLMDQGYTEKAIASYESLAKQFPKDEDIQFAYALLLINNKQDEKAIAKLQSLIPLNANRAHYVLGALYEDKNDRDNAQKYFSMIEEPSKTDIAHKARAGQAHGEQASENDYYIDSQIRVIRLLNHKKQYDTSLEKIEQLNKKYPEAYASFVQLEAETVSQAGRPLEGYAILSLLLNQDPNNDTYLYNRAMLAGSYGEIDLFEADMRALLAKHPNNPTYLNALGYTLAEHNIKLDEAEMLLREALALDPDSAAINDSWGWLQYRLGNIDVAIIFVELAIQKFYDGEIVAHLGELYWQKGEHEKAISIWNQYLKTDPEHRLLRETMLRFNQL